MANAFGQVLTKVFGSRNERLLKRYTRMVEQINAIEPEIAAKSDEELRARVAELKAGLTAGALQAEAVMHECFALIRESMDRNIGIRSIFDPEKHFDPEKLSDQMLEEYDGVQRLMISSGASWQTAPIPVKLYQAIREIYPESRPPFRARCFDVQLIGGLVLYDGRIAEMATGEGKTFVAPLACFMRSLQGYHCHVVTVNDYLVRRDANWLRPAFENLGLSIGFIQSDMEPGGEARRAAYRCDVTYGTNAEFGFDFLRDNMKETVASQVQGPLDFAIVDEVDSILIDEARTPLIISGAAHDDAPKYRAADLVARKVIEMHRPYDQADRASQAAQRAMKAAEGDEDRAKGKAEKEACRKRRAQAEIAFNEAEERKAKLVQYYEVELDRKTVHLTHEGIAAAQEVAGVGSFFVGNNMEWPHLMEQAMRAHVVYERDKDYVVERGPKGELEVVIVDEYTGRKMAGRQWSEGLHQSVEAKERVPIKQETQTLATITLQNFFKMYRLRAGMTGTAQTEAEEFSKIYELEVVTIPTNRPIRRDDREDRVYRTEQEKWQAIIDEIKEFSEQGRPVLVGTTSVEKSEMLSNLLKRKYGIDHEVLNAKQHEREAHIVEKAGLQHTNAHNEEVGNVTIATNMAGRGTDIKLSPKAFDAGGLHVIGTERHTARRIDNQLRGRSGRQGDPGSSRFYVSLQDDLMKMFAGEWVIKVLGWLGMEEGQPIEDKRISKGILKAQKKVEERNFLARKNLLEYDEVMDHQRTTFYGMRQRVLKGLNIADVIWDMIGQSIEDAVDKYITQDYIASTAVEWARTNFELSLETSDLSGVRDVEQLERYIKNQARAEVETNISAELSEYLGEEADNALGWDIKGMQAWAMRKLQVNLTTSQIRQSNPKELEDKLRAAAVEQIDRRDCSGLVKFMEPQYAEKELANWAREKFGIAVQPDDFLLNGSRKNSAEIIELIDQRARTAYTRRELEYPVEHALTFAFGATEGVSTDNPYGAEFLKEWARAKYDVDLSTDRIRAISIKALREELVAHQERFLHGGKMTELVDQMMADEPDAEKLRLRLNQRFGLFLTSKDMEIKPVALQKEGDPKSLRELADNKAMQFFRRELTELEQFVLIRIFDQSWKDHLYAMDTLKAGIGLHAFAERDPRVLFKKEGFEYFQQMMAGVRDKVTDLIFRARVVGAAQQKSNYRETATSGAEQTGYGVSENLAADAAAGATTGQVPQSEMAAAGSRTQGEAAVKSKPIVREADRVGRNDLCPCGSGKKYKKCCGANVA